MFLLLSQVKCIRWDCVYTSCRTFSGMITAGSWSDLRDALGSVRFLFERYQAGWISQQKVVESASLLNLWGFPIMRTITATTAFKMPLYGISSLLSALQRSRSFFQERKQPASVASQLLRRDKSKQAFISIKDRFYPLGRIELFFIFSKHVIVAENCIDPILQFRFQVMDHHNFSGCGKRSSA